jgi:hypothetical protein
MTSTATAALWAVALIAAYLTLAPMLGFLNSTFSSLPMIGL